MREVGALISEYENLAIREAMEGQDLPRDFQPPFICPTFDYGEEFGLCERALTAKMFA